MTHILKLDHDDPLKELEFELEFQSTLTLQQRFDMMVRTSQKLREMLIRNGHRKPVEIVKRT